MRGERPDHRASQIVPDPDGRPRPEVIVKFDHILHDLFQGIRLRGNRRRGSAVAAHVGRDAPPPLVRESFYLRAPHQPDLRPAMGEDDQRSVGGGRLPSSGLCDAAKRKYGL